MVVTTFVSSGPVNALARLGRHLWFARIVMSADVADMTEPVAPELQGMLDAVCYAS